MMNLFISTYESNWGFGTSELIALISAVATFAAVAVSLFLALKSKTIKSKIYVDDKMAGIKIRNSGDTKFLVSAFGVEIDGTYYINSYERICKLLPIAKQVSQHQTSFQEFSLGYVLLEPGDVAEIGLQYFDYTLFKKNKTFLFVVVSNKLKKFKIDIDKVDMSKNHPEMLKYHKIDKNDIKDLGFYLHR